MNLIKEFQSTILEMFLNGRLTEEEFNLLSVLSENMKADKDALELAIKLNQEDLNDKEAVECILRKHFNTARLLLDI